MTHTNPGRFSHYGAFALTALVGVALLAAPEAAYAQAEVTSFLTKVVNWLKAGGLLIVTLAIMWVGYKILFAGARFADVAYVFIGALFIGSAATIAGWLIGG